jgi:gentisate 1,2-dioxygenase
MREGGIARLTQRRGGPRQTEEVIAGMNPTPLATDGLSDVISTELRRRLVEAHLVPLWESPTAHKLDPTRERPFLWPWRVLGPVLQEVSEISSPEIVERRVLSLVNPKSTTPADEATTGVISAAVQALLPGERARPHRHSMNALRFVLEGSGARTVVDGKPCPMEPGDLIITPAWCWHEHVSAGDKATTWVDVLDVALHLALGTDEFQPGPITGARSQPADLAYQVPNVLPCVDLADRPHSPVFRYPLGDAVRALANAPRAADGSRQIRYVNPLDGGPAMRMLDCTMLEIDAAARTHPLRSTASALAVVVDGHGTSDIGGETISWGPKDVFTLPQRAAVSHRATQGPARLFMVSNREVYQRLGLLSESHVD